MAIHHRMYVISARESINVCVCVCVCVGGGGGHNWSLVF